MSILTDVGVTHENVLFGDRTWIRAGTYLLNSIIGSDTFINFACGIYNSTIGNNTQIASKVQIGSKSGITRTIVGDCCWIGADSIIRDGVIIGDNCVIGANADVYQNIPDNSVAYCKNGSLIVHDREFTFDALPEFKKLFEYNLSLGKQSSDYSCDKDGNYLLADIRGEDFQIGRNNILVGRSSTNGYIQIGENVLIGNNNILEGAGKIRIGPNTKIGNNVHILSNSHNYHFASLPMILEPTYIGENVIIDDDTLILGGTIIPNNVHLEKRSFVLKNKVIKR
ncbi:acyltransferase [Lactococcus lactis]|uniref:acyltransferase n=1 Tax=Lactococcus lactis TaxID=1358 RepID=UPI0011111C09|nr:DapH/DapD/GlmU-related protein [Lactococcus lactis]